MTDENQKKSIEEIHDYWINNSTPGKYKSKLERSEFLTNHINKYARKKDSILEIGCNVGRNLNHLFEHGYQNLSGIEISEEALIELKKSYPNLDSNSELFHASIEDIIPKLKDGQFDVVFTMAVLEHIHPDSDWVFDEIVRITGHYLVIVEAEQYDHWRVFKRDYEQLFTDLGMNQIYMTSCEDGGLKHYMLRIFKK